MHIGEESGEGGEQTFWQGSCRARRYEARLARLLSIAVHKLCIVFIACQWTPRPAARHSNAAAGRRQGRKEALHAKRLPVDI